MGTSDILLGVTLRHGLASHPGGSSNTLSCFMLPKQGHLHVSFFDVRMKPFMTDSLSLVSLTHSCPEIQGRYVKLKEIKTLSRFRSFRFSPSLIICRWISDSDSCHNFSKSLTSLFQSMRSWLEPRSFPAPVVTLSQRKDPSARFVDSYRLCLLNLCSCICQEKTRKSWSWMSHQHPGREKQKKRNRKWTNSKN